MNEKILHIRESVLVQIFYLFIVPILLLYFNIINIEWRVPVLLLICLFIYGIIRHEKWPAKKLGLHFPTHRFIIEYVIFTLLGIIALIIAAHFFGKGVPTGGEAGEWWENPRLILLFVPVSLLQEFAFRGFLFPLLREAVKSTAFVVLINTLVFMFLHIIFPPLSIALPVAFIAGLAFALMYLKYPDLVLIGASHCLLNFVAVLFGFFVIK